MANSRQLSIRKVTSEEGFRELRNRWNSLLEISPVDCFFLRWEWLWAWWSTYAKPEYELCIILVLEGETLIGIGPFYINNAAWSNIAPLKHLLFLGTSDKGVVSEYLDIIYRAGDDEVVVRAIVGYISREKLFHDIRLQKMDAASKTMENLRKVADELGFLYLVENTSESPYLTLPGDYGKFLDDLSGSMRHSISSNARKLQHYAGVEYRKSLTIDELGADLEELVRLHRHRWESRKQQGAFSERFLMFQRMIMPDMLANGHLELWFLSVAGRNISALYNIRYKEKIYFYQGGLDAAFDRGLAPGVLLHNYCIQQAIQENLKEYDFLFMGNLDSYKKRWTRTSRRMSDIYLARPGIVRLAAAARNKARAIYHLMKENVN